MHPVFRALLFLLAASFNVRGHHLYENVMKYYILKGEQYINWYITRLSASKWNFRLRQDALNFIYLLYCDNKNTKVKQIYLYNNITWLIFGSTNDNLSQINMIITRRKMAQTVAWADSLRCGSTQLSENKLMFRVYSEFAGNPNHNLG